MNCATVPPELALSHLFGHVPGAYTGSKGRREGLVPKAHGGTLFLDEVGKLPPPVQPALLRVLDSGVYSPVGSDETKRAQVRIIAGTNQDLRAMVAAGTFLPDLYFRLVEQTVTLPPLRQRPEDVRLLGDASLPGDATLSEACVEALLAHGLPGNVRELRSLVASAVDRQGLPLTVEKLELPAEADDDDEEPSDDERRTRALEGLLVIAREIRDALANLGRCADLGHGGSGHHGSGHGEAGHGEAGQRDPGGVSSRNPALNHDQAADPDMGHGGAGHGESGHGGLGHGDPAPERTRRWPRGRPGPPHGSSWSQARRAAHVAARDHADRARKELVIRALRWSVHQGRGQRAAARFADIAWGAWKALVRRLEVLGELRPDLTPAPV